MQRSTNIAVAGATGRVGRPVVDILESRGYDVVPISRSQGVDVGASCARPSSTSSWKSSGVGADGRRGARRTGHRA